MHPIDYAQQTSQYQSDISRRLALNIARLCVQLERPGWHLRVGHDLTEAADFHRAVTDAPLSLLADPALARIRDARAQVLTLLVQDEAGQPLGCSVQRLRHVPLMTHAGNNPAGSGRGLAGAMRSLRFWFDDLQDAPPFTRCIAEGALLERIHGWVVYSCAYAMAREAQREPGAAAALVRLAHALALNGWSWSWLVGRGGLPLATRFAFDRYGVDQIGNGCWLLHAGTRIQDADAHPHVVMAAAREDFLGQALRADYGDATRSLRIPDPVHAEMARRDMPPRQQTKPT